MKKLLSIIMLLIIMTTLSSCSSETNPQVTKDFVLGEIDFYLLNNDLLDDLFDTNLPDVEESLAYTKDDFVNFDLKNTNNVDIEYDDYYSSFSNLLFVEQVIRKLDNFQYDTCYRDTISVETLCVHYSDEVLKIEYYENVAELNVIMSHRYELSKLNGVAQMVKYITIYDTQNDIEILNRKIEIYGHDYIIDQEFYPETRSFVYEYTSYLDQDYFMYKGTLDPTLEYIRQTVEYYIPQFNAFVSYDIKEDTLEDYRVKIFNQGHRVVKVDVNVKDNNPTVNELTWNVLNFTGWTNVQLFSDSYFLYQGSFVTMQDYEIDVQLNGYGKVIAYKLFEGELTDEDITLEEYSMNSGYTLDDVVNAKLYFESNYVSELLKYGFTSNEPNNRFIVSDEVVFQDNELARYVSRIK